MQMLGGVLVAAVAVIAVGIAVSAGGGSTHTVKAKSKEAQSNYRDVASLLKGIPQNGTTLGNPKAKVTIDYYGDLECPICRSFTLGQQGGGFPQLVSNEVRSGKVKLVYRSFCTATCGSHPQSTFNLQQVAAYAAGQQKQFWDYAELFYREQQSETTAYVNNTFLKGLAEQLPNLNLATWQTDRGNSALLSQVQADEKAASDLGLPGTPALVAIGPKGETLVNSGNFPDYTSIQQAISKVE